MSREIASRKLLAAVTLAALVAVGCDDKSETKTAAIPAVSTPAVSTPAVAVPEMPAVAALPATLRLAAAPAGATDVAALRASVKDGDRIVARGVVAGRADPIAANRAILTLLDNAIKTCDRTGDGCKTPWDACCEPADSLAKNSLTVQVVDADGRPLKVSLASLPGLKPLARLVVTGTAKVSADGAVLLNADGLFIEP